LIVIGAEVPTFALVGLPVNVPVTVLKPAHEGLLTMPKVTPSPFAPVTVGLKV
jgi:hypothetical protein